MRSTLSFPLTVLIPLALMGFAFDTHTPTTGATSTAKKGADDGPVVLEGYTFTTVDFPGSTYTFCDGNNPRGDVVGAYDDAEGRHGYLLSGSEFTSWRFPGSSFTSANGINPAGDIVGRYILNGVNHVYLLSGGEFTSFDLGDGSPCLDCNTATGIAPNGDIVGNYTVAGHTHGYLRSGDTFTSIDYPDATRTAALKINPRGDIVGNFTIAGVKHGYLLDQSGFTAIDFPGATMPDSPTANRLCASTCALGINPRGDIVGAYTTADGVTHGYLLSEGEFTSFDVPGASFTGPLSINPRGDISGQYILAGRTHGFLLSRHH